MNVFPASKFLAALHQIAGFNQFQITALDYNANSIELFREQFLKLRQDVDDVRSSLREIELEHTLAAADRIAEELAKVPTSNEKVFLDKITLARFRKFADQMISRVPDEIGLRLVLIVSSGNQQFYKPDKPLFGDSVQATFLDAAYDISEAGKCLALERSTAAVFHLMRAMEVAVKVVGQKLRATVSKENGETIAWGVIVGNIKPKIEVMPKGQEQDEWFKIHALLHSVNRAFRTKTAHPVHKYTQGEARDAFNATKAFMQELAAKCIS